MNLQTQLREKPAIIILKTYASRFTRDARQLDLETNLTLHRYEMTVQYRQQAPAKVSSQPALEDERKSKDIFRIMR